MFVSYNCGFEFDWTGNPILLFYVIVLFSNLAFYKHIT